MIRPLFHAILNGAVAVALVSAVVAIRCGYRRVHIACTTAAIAASTVFLVSYIQYHATTHIITRYPHHDWTRIAYLTMLVSHTILAIGILPFIAIAVYHASRGNFARHKAYTRWVFPLWLYVAVTGVMIYWVLY